MAANQNRRNSLLAAAVVLVIAAGGTGVWALQRGTDHVSAPPADEASEPDSGNVDAVALPRFIGMTLADARDAARAARLRLRVIGKDDPTGLVVAQDPPARLAKGAPRTKVSAGTEISVQVE